VWKMTIFRILSIGLIGIALFYVLLYCIGFCEARYIRRRSKNIIKEKNHMKSKIIRFYILLLFLFIILSFLLIKLHIRGVQ
jgi:uncharacterized membrane protein